MSDSPNVIHLTRQELYEQVWTTPVSRLCRRYGLSDVGLRKTCKRHDIPLPPLGYWSKIQHGKEVQQTPLPPSAEGEADRISFVLYAVTEEGRSGFKDVEKLLEREKDPQMRIDVSQELNDPLPVVERTWKSLRSAKVDEHGLVRPRARRCLDVHVSPANIDRAMRVWDALLRALEVRGIEVSQGDEQRPTTCISVAGERFCISVDEVLDKKERPLTDKEKEEQRIWSWWHTRPKYVHFPSGRLSLYAHGGPALGRRRTWSDCAKAPVERMLNTFLRGIYGLIEANRIRRAEQERENQRRAEEARRRREEEERRRREEEQRLAEQRRFEQLLGWVKAWREAEDIRAFINEVEERATASQGAIEQGSELEELIGWSRSRADEIDPIKF